MWPKKFGNLEKNCHLSSSFCLHQNFQNTFLRLQISGNEDVYESYEEYESAFNFCNAIFHDPSPTLAYFTVH